MPNFYLYTSTHSSPNSHLWQPHQPNGSGRTPQVSSLGFRAFPCVKSYPDRGVCPAFHLLRKKKRILQPLPKKNFFVVSRSDFPRPAVRVPCGVCRVGAVWAFLPVRFSVWCKSVAFAPSFYLLWKKSGERLRLLYTEKNRQNGDMSE